MLTCIWNNALHKKSGQCAVARPETRPGKKPLHFRSDKKKLFWGFCLQERKKNTIKLPHFVSGWWMRNHSIRSCKRIDIDWNGGCTAAEEDETAASGFAAPSIPTKALLMDQRGDRVRGKGAGKWLRAGIPPARAFFTIPRSEGVQLPGAKKDAGRPPPPSIDPL